MKITELPDEFKYCLYNVGYHDRIAENNKLVKNDCPRYSDKYAGKTLKPVADYYGYNILAVNSYEGVLYKKKMSKADSKVCDELINNKMYGVLLKKKEGDMFTIMDIRSVSDMFTEFGHCGCIGCVYYVGFTDTGVLYVKDDTESG